MIVRAWAAVRSFFTIDGAARSLDFGGRVRMESTHLFLAILALSILLHAANVGVFLDDVFIYLRVVDQIAAGNGPVLNPGDLHFAVTGPLWLYLLAFLKMLFGSIDTALLAKYASIALLAAASWAAFALLRRRVGYWAALVPLPIFFNYISVTTAGGEIALVYCCLFGTLWSYLSRRDLALSGLVGAAGYLARPELILMMPIIALHRLFVWRKERQPARALIADWAKLALAFLAVAGIWHAYYAARFHSLFPGTLRAKVTQGRSGQWPLYHREMIPLARSIFSPQYGLVIPLVLGSIYFRGASLLLFLFGAAHYLAYRLLAVPYYHWYYYDLFLLLPVFTAFGSIALLLAIGRGIEHHAERARPGRGRSRRLRAGSGIAVALMAAFCIVTTTKISSLDRYRSDRRLDSYREIAAAIEPEIRKGDVLLSAEIGILGYYLKDAIVRDVNGIGSPDTNVENIDKLDYFVAAYAPRFLFFPVFKPQTERILRFETRGGGTALYELLYPDTDLTTRVDCVYRLVSVE